MGQAVVTFAPIVLTALLALAGSFFADSNPFTDCTDENDCLDAALENIQDESFVDALVDIAQVPFIFFGDLFAVMAEVRELAGEVVGTLLLIITGLSWIIMVAGLLL